MCIQYVDVDVCRYMHMSAGSHRHQKRVSDLLEMELL